MTDTPYHSIFKAVHNGNDVRGAAIATESEQQTLTPDMAVLIAKAFGIFLAWRAGKNTESLRIGIGHDSRLSAAELKEAVMTGLEKSSLYDCGLITTPAMFQSTVLEESSFDGAVMLTASHLPFNRNGMKFFTGEGALSHMELDKIMEIAVGLAKQYGKITEEGDFILHSLPAAKGSSEPYSFDMVSVYCSHMKNLIKESVECRDEEYPLSGLHIVVDSGNGASGFFATRILAPLGADISGSQFLDPDGHFPNHAPNPENETAMRSISEAVVKAKADLGVIFDCDGDRAAVVFADGTEVNRNTLIALLSAIVSETAPGSCVVTDSITSDELGEFLSGHLGLKHLRYQRGYKNVIDKAVSLNRAGELCELAIETSGHGAFKENYFSDDGAYIALKIICKMARMKAEGKKIEDLIKDLRQPAQAKEYRIPIRADDAREYGEKILRELSAYCTRKEGVELAKPNYEGVRINFHDDEVKGWMLLRLSLHDPEMAMNIESEKEGGCDIILDRVRSFLSQYEGLGLLN